jgi:hypothetical protein
MTCKNFRRAGDVIGRELGTGATERLLITEGSRYFRTEKSHAPGYLSRVHQYQEKGSPGTFTQGGNLAGMTFGLNHPTLPILLRRDRAPPTSELPFSLKARLALRPDRIDLNWRLFDVYSSIVDDDQARSQLGLILKQTPEDQAARGYANWLKNLK